MDGGTTTRLPGPDERAPGPPGGSGPLSSVTVDVVVPVHDEERALPGCVAVLHAYFTEHLPFDWTITVADSGSTDRTRAIALELAEALPRVRVVCLDRRGKGSAVRAAWISSTAAVVAYMDVDLSTGLDALVPLLAALAVGHSDLAIGSRLVPGARTVRGARRELISRGYNTLLRLTHKTRFLDAQCGFKAARSDVVRPLLRHVEDDAWFFDTELLLLAEHNGLRVLELPVDWVEDVDSRVRVTRTAAANVRGLARIALARLSGAAYVAGLPPRPAPAPTHPDAVLGGQASRLRALLLFCVIGFAATATTVVLYTAFRTWWPPLPANLAAVALSALLTTSAHQRSTSLGRSRSPLQALLVFLLYCAFTSGSLLALTAFAARASRWAEIAVLLVASAVGAVGRFALLNTAFRRPGRGRVHVPRQREESIR
ncbi:MULTISPECIES: glycosyltransferase [Actinosynnema]|uniref:glycosyltransferase n=1 Tax=Actinosynnema TaxID=40566 RepID=UPI0020A3781B|nr:glycosyltransferase [Actinosynnema pretiosum]MCP2094958.1 Glycosyltransferase involved in cell wall bisynthesis [Actinosynnema pretiosum]